MNYLLQSRQTIIMYNRQHTVFTATKKFALGSQKKKKRKKNRIIDCEYDDVIGC